MTKNILKREIANMAKSKSTKQQECSDVSRTVEVAVNAINNNKLRWRTRYLMPILLESDKNQVVPVHER